jgi:hypothetical protein
MKVYGGSRDTAPFILNPEIDEDEFHSPATLHPCKEKGVYRIGGWVGPRESLDSFEEEKNFLPLPGIELRVPKPIA